MLSMVLSGLIQNSVEVIYVPLALLRMRIPGKSNPIHKHKIQHMRLYETTTVDEKKLKNKYRIFPRNRDVIFHVLMLIRNMSLERMCYSMTKFLILVLQTCQTKSLQMKFND